MRFFVLIHLERILHLFAKFKEKNEKILLPIIAFHNREF